jgi:hypothetical protein
VIISAYIVVVSLVFVSYGFFWSQGQSDLYKWRSIFRLYMEAQVFVSTSEHDRGERSVEDAEVRLFRFAHAVGEDEFSFKLNDSRDGLKRFLELNVRLIEIKKVQLSLSSD